jgi:hypothetical protein
LLKMPRKAVYSISSVIVLMACGYAFLQYIFWEPSGIERGSLVYQLKIPDIAKNYPTWGELGVPLYDLRIADGEKPRLVRVYYTSALDLPNLISRSKELGFNCLAQEQQQVLCYKNDAGGTQHEISLKETRKGTEVKVDIIGDQQ